MAIAKAIHDCLLGKLTVRDMTEEEEKQHVAGYINAAPPKKGLEDRIAELESKEAERSKAG